MGELSDDKVWKVVITFLSQREHLLPCIVGEFYRKH